jgi:RNA-directed DNA polymerase
MGRLYNKVSRLPALRKAWSVVRANGLQSTSEDTRHSVEVFAQEADKNLKRIAKQLKAGSFSFPLARGIPIPKKGKATIRPIVITPVESRIVQRALLDVIVGSIKEIKPILSAGFNFGGVEDGGVPKAISAAYRASQEHKYYIRTDIQAFFDNVPREKAVSIVSHYSNDPQFDGLLTKATNIELDNLSKLGRHKAAFPLAENGVAQGSCLSPLLCNLLLHEFDVKLNSHDTTCVRYIDDFIIFAPNRKKAFQALKIAKRHLKSLNLDAYDPTISSEKAECGETAIGFDFLGCSIKPDGIRPGRKAKQSLLEKVRFTLTNIILSQIYLHKHSRSMPPSDLTLLKGLWKVSNTIKAWGNTFSFCTDDRIFVDLDRMIEEELDRFRDDYRAKLTVLTTLEKRRLTGVSLLDDCKKDAEFRELVALHNGRSLRTAA